MAIELLVGADPELFLKRGDKYFSAHGKFQGDKKNPLRVNKGAVQVDGMAAEFNIDPARNPEEFAANIQAVMIELKKLTRGFKLAADPVAEFGAAYMAKQPEEALELGCEPDYCAWTDGKANPRPNGAADFRTGSGHVHIGWGNDLPIEHPEHIKACCALSKQLDFYLGLPSLLFDDNVKRRQLYGKAGAFRPKSYGVEYRTLSNRWLSSPKLMKWVFSNTKLAFDRLVNGETYFNDGKAEWAMFRIDGVERVHKKQIKEVLEYYKVPLPPVEV